VGKIKFTWNRKRGLGFST